MQRPPGLLRGVEPRTMFEPDARDIEELAEREGSKGLRQWLQDTPSRAGGGVVNPATDYLDSLIEGPPVPPGLPHTADPTQPAAPDMVSRAARAAIPPPPVPIVAGGLRAPSAASWPSTPPAVLHHTGNPYRDFALDANQNPGYHFDLKDYEGTQPNMEARDPGVEAIGSPLETGAAAVGAGLAGGWPAALSAFTAGNLESGGAGALRAGLEHRDPLEGAVEGVMTSEGWSPALMDKVGLAGLPVGLALSGLTPDHADLYRAALGLAKRARPSSLTGLASDFGRWSNVAHAGRELDTSPAASITPHMVGNRAPELWMSTKRGVFPEGTPPPAATPMGEDLERQQEMLSNPILANLAKHQLTPLAAEGIPHYVYSTGLRSSWGGGHEDAFVTKVFGGSDNLERAAALLHKHAEANGWPQAAIGTHFPDAQVANNAGLQLLRPDGQPFDPAALNRLSAAAEKHGTNMVQQPDGSVHFLDFGGEGEPFFAKSLAAAKEALGNEGLTDHTAADWLSSFGVNRGLIEGKDADAILARTTVHPATAGEQSGVSAPTRVPRRASRAARVGAGTAKEAAPEPGPHAPIRSVVGVAAPAKPKEGD